LPWKIIEPDALELLQQHDWPGNVRELENMMQRLAALYSEEVIDAEIISTELNDGRGRGEQPVTQTSGLADAVDAHMKNYFSAHDGALPAAGLYGRVLKEVERPLIMQTLQVTRGNQVKASEVLGLNRNTLRKKIRELGIPIIKGSE
jgi:two-component system nitrogen regulation response regulator GlnG